MNKAVLYLFFILTISFKCFSQDINLNESDLIQMLAKNWKLDYGLLNGEKVQGLEIVDDEFYFKSDHTYKLGSDNSSFVNGTWKFNVEKKRVELYSETGSSSGYIKYIEKNKIILLPGEKSLPDSFKLELIYIPKQ